MHKESTLRPPLLTTKLQIPPLRPELVDRPRLIRRIEQGLHRKLTLVSAPAGFGKTTLLSAWAHGSTRAVGWVALEGGDNDPARFLTYCLAALQRLRPGLGEGLSVKLQSLHRSAREATLTGLINELAEAPDPLALVFDDYHLIEDESVRACLSFLVEHLPPQIHLIISTRADPDLPLSLLRARGQLNELRAADLRFGPGEAESFLNRLMGFRLSRGDVEALAARTEGWIAGLQMAAVSLQGREDTGAFIAEFTGSNRYILDYLVEEVLQRQPPAVQRFLLQSSILERMSGPLCDAVTERQGGSQTLTALERGGLFIEALDEERQWYRYHRIFAGLLRSRLAREYAAELPALHQRAAQWFHGSGFVAEAIVHSLAASDYERAAALIETGAEECLMRGEVASFVEWVEALPEERVCGNPRLCIYHAFALLMQGHPVDRVQARLDDAGGCGEERAVHGELLAFRATLAFLQGDFHESVDQARHALEHLGESSLFRVLTIRLLASAAYIESGDIDATIRTVEENVRRSRQARNLVGSVVCLCELAELHIARGELSRAQTVYEEAWREARGPTGRPLPIGGMPRVGLGELYREWNDLERAEVFLGEGIELARDFGVIACLDGFISLAWVRQARGDHEGALRAITEAQRLATQFDASELDDILVTLNLARLWLAQHRVREASRWAEGWLEERSSRRFLPSYHIRELDDMTLARVRLAEGRVHEALQLLDGLLSSVRELGRTGSLIELQALRALCLWVHDRREESLEALAEALRLAEPEGYVRRFVDCPAPMPTLLYESAARGIGGAYVGTLLAALGGAPAAESAGRGRKAGCVVEPLSDRELDVLRLLAEGLSNKQVADRLFISLATVKWHTSNIYGKLEVRNRTGAVARARALGLLPLA